MRLLSLIAKEIGYRKVNFGLSLFRTDRKCVSPLAQFYGDLWSSVPDMWCCYVPGYA